MSTNTQKKHSDLKNIGIVLFVVLLVVIALFSVGCSAPSASPDPQASAATTPSEEPAPAEPVAEKPAMPVFGETVSYDDGVSISVSAPAPFEPSEYAAGVVAGQPVVAFELVITNNGTEPFDPATVFATIASGGTEAAGVFDTEKGIGFPPMTTVLPGSTVKWNQAWSVADPSNITMEVSVGFLNQPAIFVSSK